VSDLVSTNAEGDLQHFQTADFLAQRRIVARSALFDVSKVKGRYVRDRQSNRWFSHGSIAESMHWMVLHRRPIETAAVM
jgi:hypothetical protein